MNYLEIFGNIQALIEVYGKECMSRTSVFEWHKRFRADRTRVVNELTSPGPNPARTRKYKPEPENISPNPARTRKYKPEPGPRTNLKPKSCPKKREN